MSDFRPLCPPPHLGNIPKYKRFFSGFPIVNFKISPFRDFYEVAIQVCREDGRCPKRNNQWIWVVTYLRKTNCIIVFCLPILRPSMVVA